MKVFRLLVITALTGGALLVLAPGAHAASTTSTCAALDTLESQFSDLGTKIKNPSDLSNAYDDVGAAYHKAARQAPKKLKSALNTLGDTYESIDNPGDLVTTLKAKKYTKALKKFVTFVSTDCSGS